MTLKLANPEILRGSPTVEKMQHWLLERSKRKILVPYTKQESFVKNADLEEIFYSTRPHRCATTCLRHNLRRCESFAVHAFRWDVFKNNIIAYLNNIQRRLKPPVQLPIHPHIDHLAFTQKNFRIVSIQANECRNFHFVMNNPLNERSVIVFHPINMARAERRMRKFRFGCIP